MVQALFLCKILKDTSQYLVAKNKMSISSVIMLGIVQCWMVSIGIPFVVADTE
jgi:hypothetical protein